MTSSALCILSIAVPVPVGEAFDYLWASDEPPPAPGTRVTVPLGRREQTGIVLKHGGSSARAAHELKHVKAVLDEQPLLDDELLATLRWVADYYHYPIGEVLMHALPSALRHGAPVMRGREMPWRLTAQGQRARAELPARAHQQQRLLDLLASAGSMSRVAATAAGVTAAAWRRAEQDGWIEAAPESTPTAAPEIMVTPGPTTTADQQAALDAIASAPSGYAAFLLHGVTGSGKTEVYLKLIETVLAEGRQILLLVPEIALTPQLVKRLTARFGSGLALLHSGLTDSERLVSWRRSRSADARLVVGTRSAVFAPLPRLGLIVVDEEHDGSYKQQAGLRYSARDLAVFRARQRQVPIVLASATPSLESYHNALRGRYRLLSMPRRIGSGGRPTLRFIDMNQHASQQGLSTPLLAALDRHLERGNQALLFLNRRGFAPALFCSRCLETEMCRHCDARMTVHAARGRLQCHHCGSKRPLRWSCPACGQERIAVGAGTQRVTERLQALYPEHRIARLDRDATARKGALAAILDDVAEERTRLLVGTQMLTKGHDFPKVTLVGVLNADQGLFGTDFRSSERLVQSVLQVAGRAGRRDEPGEVLIQTHYPTHPLLRCLEEQDYGAFAALALDERRAARWPPFAHLALWQAEASHRESAFEFLTQVRRRLPAAGGAVKALGPAPAAMERREGRYRAQLLVHSAERARLHDALAEALAALGPRRRQGGVRWSLDVDPLEV